MAGERMTFWTLVVLASVGKLLMLKSYRSTDFEVHRNWLAITNSLPLDRWYYEETSEWTLDYPPFFAYFEWILSQGAKLFDPGMLKLENLNYASNATILFQKGSVIATDLVLALGVLESASAVRTGILPKSKTEPIGRTTLGLFCLIFINGGLFMLDHIHFQYNGFLFGILLLSIAKICQGKVYQGAFLFASLLCFKHIFLYLAPAVGVYLLRLSCVKTNHRGIPVSVALLPLLSFAGIGALVGTMAFALFYKHIPQILQRLFPFQRGLSHAYWAPNVWAAYNTLDLILSYGLKLGKSGVTSGLVGESSLAVLPQVRPIHTFLLTLLVMLPVLWRLWAEPSARSFIYAIVLTAWTSFMFGYHVHEKAILNVIIPLALVATHHPNLFILTLSAGTVSLFPLLFTPFEAALKAVIAVGHVALAMRVVGSRLTWWQTLYIAGFVPVYAIENFGQLLLPKLPFLPLILVSDYTLLANIACYGYLYVSFVFPPKSRSKGSVESKAYVGQSTESSSRMSLRKRK